MAKYVLLHFEDDDEADEFVQRFTDDVEERSRYMRVGIYADVRSVYKAPTKFCSHGGASGPFTKGRKFGWWVHAVAGCMKPTTGWVTGALENREYNQLKKGEDDG
jgi:hypothetical protein